MKIRNYQFFFLLVKFLKIQAGEYRQNLTNFLLGTSNQKLLTLPVQYDNASLLMTLGVLISQIVEINDEKDLLTISASLNLQWIDSNLVWDPVNFGNLKAVRLPIFNIWLPDIAVLNAADTDSLRLWNTNHIIYAHVTNNGTVKVILPYLLSTSCEMVINDFPFDEKHCLLDFSSMTYDINTINLTASSAKVIATNYVNNQAWDLENATQHSFNVTNDFDVENFSVVRVELHLRRRSLYFVYNLIFPTCIISIFCLIGFILPASSGEKVVLEVTNYLAVIFFSQYVADILPKSSLGIPKISLYFGSLIIQCLVSVCVNIYIIRLNEGEHDENKIPDWIEKWICGYLAYFLKMKRPKNQSESILLDEYQDSKNNEKKNLTDIEKYLKLITTHLNSIKISQNKNNDKKLLENDRKFVASVLDRFFFFVSLVYLIICLVSFILANKNFWRFT